MGTVYLIDFFISNFLTLFSNVFILNNNCKKFMIFIFENFMIKGWKIKFTEEGKKIYD